MNKNRSATLLRASDCTNLHSSSLLKSDSAREQLLKTWQECGPRILQSVNKTLGPLVSLGYPELDSVVMLRESSIDNTLFASPGYYRFALINDNEHLALLAVDRCTLDQLAGAVYGSKNFDLASPLRMANNSDARQAAKVVVNFCKAVLGAGGADSPFRQTKFIQSTDVNQFDCRHAALFEMHWPEAYPFHPVRLMLSDSLLGQVFDQQDLPLPEPVDYSVPFEAALMDIPVEFNVELGRASVPLQHLSQLKPGDILPIQLHSESPLSVNGEVLFHGSTHTDEDRMVVRLTTD